MKLLFLDIDGVLVTYSTMEKRKMENLGRESEGLFGQEFVDRLRTIVDKTGAFIVLSSACRIGRLSYYDVATYLAKFGIPVIDRTDCLNYTRVRGEEIQIVLDEVEKDLVSYCIVDDDSDMLESQKPYFVQTTLWDGLTQDAAEKIIAILNERQT